MTRVAFRQPAGRGLGFYTGDDGYLYVDNFRIDDVREQVAESPFYLYSKNRITANYTAYAEVAPSCRLAALILTRPCPLYRSPRRASLAPSPLPLLLSKGDSSPPRWLLQPELDSCVASYAL